MCNSNLVKIKLRVSKKSDFLYFYISMKTRLPLLPPDSLRCFQMIKEATNKRWRREKIEGCYGFQIQRHTKWREGLSKITLAEFEKAMGYEFPRPLRNFYLTMNGLDTHGINVHANNGTPPSYGPIYYSYPDDLDEIRKMIEWVLNANHVGPEDLPEKASRIFPIMGHRFLLIDDPKNRILSMFGDDIIYWSSGISSQILKTGPFPLLNHQGFAHHGTSKGIKFWLD